jgi:hypothetical protein
MARFVNADGVSRSQVSFPADFYRAEFIKHRECLALQREYFSERAITDADAALGRVLSQLEQLCAKDDGGVVIEKLLRTFNAVTGLSGWADPKQLH